MQSIQFIGAKGTKVLEITTDGEIKFNTELSVDEITKGLIEAVETAAGRKSYNNRVHDLLVSNNAYLMRSRKSEELLAEALDRLEPLTQADEDFLLVAREYLKT